MGNTNQIYGSGKAAPTYKPGGYSGPGRSVSGFEERDRYFGSPQEQEQIIGAIREMPRVDRSDQGMSAMDYMQAILSGAGSQQPAPSSGGSRSRSRSGSGGSGGVAPAQMQSAYQAYIDSLAGNDMSGIYAGLRANLGNVYQPLTVSDDPVNNRYAQYQQAIQQAATQGQERLGDIGADLGARNAQTAAALQQATAQGDQRLSDLREQFIQGGQGEAAGLNNILNSFDAGSVRANNAPLESLFAASQANNAANGNLFAQSQADRAGLGASLQADVGLSMGQQQDALIRQIAAQRAAGLQQNDLFRQQQAASSAQARQQAEADLFIKEAQAKQQQAEAVAAARLQAAQMGITL